MGYYHDLIVKQAGVAKYVNSLDDIIKAVVKATGKNPDDAAKLVQKSMDIGGTGSLFVDKALDLAKKIPSGSAAKQMPEGLSRKARKSLLKESPELYKRPSRYGDRIDNTSWAIKKKIDQFDMDAGARLGKNNRWFDQDVKIKLDDDELGGVERTFKTKRLSAPISKTKETIVPIAGAMAISSGAYKLQDKLRQSKEGGGNFEYQQY